MNDLEERKKTCDNEIEALSVKQQEETTEKSGLEEAVKEVNAEVGVGCGCDE